MSKLMSLQVNRPPLWRDLLPSPTPDADKYARGHVLVLGAPDLTGATRLAASASSRIGAGLVSVVATRRADVYRASLPPQVMVWDGVLHRPKRVSVVLAGCGGVDHQPLERVLARSSGCHQVLDAGAIKAVMRHRAPTDRQRIITPHLGEFDRAFPDLGGGVETRAVAAARLTASLVVLKGRDTIVAAPDGRLVVNSRSSAYLATAGTGDVLAGLIAGLLAQGMPPFEACCAAIWIHAEAAIRFGPGLVAGDIPDMVPAILSWLLAGRVSLHHMRQEDSRDEILHPDMFDCVDAGSRRSKGQKL
jgi:hydroxyethylthiazole kinase-like uncharacterized protein yjeF